MLTVKVPAYYPQELAKNDSYSKMQNDFNSLLQSCPEHERKRFLEETTGFLNIVQNYLNQSESSLTWEEISLPPKGLLLSYDTLLIPQRNKIQELLSRLVVVKLNGGLGTSMKCEGPKCLIPVRNKFTFLDVTVQQIFNLNNEFNTNVPLVLMNSFNTKEETDQILDKYREYNIKIYTFMQNKYPRIHAETLTILPSAYNDSNKSAWYPPGHGNFYESFYKSGLLKDFLLEGKKFCFVSNIDNLGAVVDFRILNLLAESRMSPEYLMEVTNKTAADVKGGTLVYYRNNFKLLEFKQVPINHLEDFKCTSTFNNFNTNNIWIKLEAIQMIVKENKLHSDVIANIKQIMKNKVKMDVLQLETAAGAGIEVFDRAIGLLVPRCRFLPVKTTPDLFLLRSNVYVNDNGKISVNTQRITSHAPLVNFPDEYFEGFGDLDKRFAGMPDCLHLNRLTVSGDVYFEKDTVLKGNVIIVANRGERIDIPQGSVLQDKIVTGGLRIVDF